MYNDDRTNCYLSLTDSGRKTFTISPVWDIEKDDVQQLVHFTEEKGNFFR